MKKLFLSVAMLALVGMTMTACKGKQTSDAPATDTTTTDTTSTAPKADSTQVADSTAAQKAAADSVAAQSNKDQMAIKALTWIYKKCVLTDVGQPGNPSKYFTKKMQRKLKAANEYEDGGMALWELRTGAQDGDGKSKLISVTPLGGDWYAVKYLDMGMKGTTKLKAVFDGDKVKFDEYKRVK